MPATVAKTLRRWMDERDLSENALARLSKVPQPTIHRILSGESNSPRRSTLAPIARVFGRSVEDLYRPDSEPAANLTLDARATEFALLMASLTDDQVDIILRTISEFRKAP